MADRVMVMVGTRKGAFIYTSDRKRQNWQIAEPMFTGSQIFHMTADVRGAEPLLYAALNTVFWGSRIARSRDLGETWDEDSKGAGYPEGSGEAVENFWNIQPGHESEPEVVWAMGGPAILLRSEDSGQSWEMNEAIARHPHRDKWGETPGGRSHAHTLLIDPRESRRMYLAISPGGTYKTEDYGGSWSRITDAMLPGSGEDTIDPGTGEPVDNLAQPDVHKMAFDNNNPDRIFARGHLGIFRSDDRGESWADISPPDSTHGFPIVVGNDSAPSVYCVPLQADMFRVCAGQFAVSRSRDGGRSWQVLTSGLPGPNDYQSVYREAMSTDKLDPHGVYVGTSNGEVYASSDEGESWQRLPGTLPPILSVEAAAL